MILPAIVCGFLVFLMCGLSGHKLLSVSCKQKNFESEIGLRKENGTSNNS